MPKLIPISEVQIGQRFSFHPAAWYGPCRLTDRASREKWNGEKVEVVYDIKFRANVVNPPGLIYGIPSSTKVRLLSQKRLLSRRGSSAGFYV